MGGDNFEKKNNNNRNIEQKDLPLITVNCDYELFGGGEKIYD